MPTLRVICFTAALAMLSAVGAHADDTPLANSSPAQPQVVSTPATVVPIYHQQLSFHLPDGFVYALHEEDKTNFTQEWVPTGETATNWSRMVTVTGNKDLATKPGLTPEIYMGVIEGNFKHRCPDTFASLYQGGSQGKAKVQSYVALFSCGTYSSNGKPYSETAMIIVLKGAKDFYTIQWAERGEAAATAVPLDKDKWLGRLKSLAPLKVIDQEGQ